MAATMKFIEDDIKGELNARKKLASLGLALALAYSISLPARAELVKNLKTDGSIETRSIAIDNETDRTPPLTTTEVKPMCA